ncbi:MAG: ABC transporter substrate-binding protein [Wenzhouxiangellaceae bacterium]
MIRLTGKSGLNWLLMALALLLATGPILAQEPEAGTPTAVVMRLESALLESMRQGEAMSFTARQTMLEPVIAESLDFVRMGRFIFGTRWSTFADTERSAFVRAFRTLSTANYAARFKRFRGESFRIIESDVDGQRARVRSELTKQDGATVTFDYLLISSDQGWRIVNIIAEGVSDLALKRTQYNSLFSRLGMSGVVEAMAEQQRQLSGD